MPKGGARPNCSIEGCDDPHMGRGMCRKHYLRMYKHGSLDDPRETKFWSNVDKASAAPCWIWIGYRHPTSGYGRHRNRQAHRVVYEKLVGPIPEGLVLDHLCRVRECVNPDHMDPVTDRENLRRGEQGQCWGYVPPAIPVRGTAEKPTECSHEGCDRGLYKRGICRPHYRKWLADPDRSSDRLASLRMSPEERFWAKVDKAGPGGCWVWTAAIDGRVGYGIFSPEHGTTIVAHRYSYQLFHGQVPDGLEVHHVCQVRACVNPRHLEAVTRSVNIRDRVLRQPLQSPGI